MCPWSILCLFIYLLCHLKIRNECKSISSFIRLLILLNLITTQRQGMIDIRQRQVCGVIDPDIYMYRLDGKTITRFLWRHECKLQPAERVRQLLFYWPVQHLWHSTHAMKWECTCTTHLTYNLNLRCVVNEHVKGAGISAQETTKFNCYCKNGIEKLNLVCYTNVACYMAAKCKQAQWYTSLKIRVNNDVTVWLQTYHKMLLGNQYYDPC